MSFTGNDISVAGEYGIYCNNCDFSEYLSNEITGPDNGIHARNSSNSDFVSNEIEVQGDYGIDAYDCDFSRIDSNVVRGYDDGVQYAIHAPESYYVNVEHNDLTEFRHMGVYFQNSANAKVNHNVIEIGEVLIRMIITRQTLGFLMMHLISLLRSRDNEVDLEGGGGIMVTGHAASLFTIQRLLEMLFLLVWRQYRIPGECNWDYAFRSTIQDNDIWVDDDSSSDVDRLVELQCTVMDWV